MGRIFGSIFDFSKFILELFNYHLSLPYCSASFRNFVSLYLIFASSLRNTNTNLLNILLFAVLHCYPGFFW